MGDLRRATEEKRRREEQGTREERLPTESSQPREQPHGGPESNQPAESSQPIQSSQPALDIQKSAPLRLIASVPDIKGEARLPHRYTDHLCKLLNPYEQAVFLQLYRLSYGWGKETCFISNPRLSERSNVPLSTCKRTVASLIDKGLIEKTGHTNGYGKEQGVEYRVLSLGWQPGESSQPATSRQPAAGPIKVNTQKENTQTQGGVGAGSKFSLEECRRYANHLQSTGQGINNPGGYATTIHRTGEADMLIEAFLKPAPAAPAVDTKACPDCAGSGFYYPNGPGGGVAKCKHTQLRNS
ncbi:MAG TPA: helix-turn-helix domain-containing protein [Pyrinomonadaceae bacterium]|jgi:hypothetical protein